MGSCIRAVIGFTKDQVGHLQRMEALIFAGLSTARELGLQSCSLGGNVHFQEPVGLILAVVISTIFMSLNTLDLPF